MLDFVKMYWSSILLVVLMIAGLIVAVKCGYTKQVKQGLLALVTKAEQELGGGTGKIKFATVANWIYEKLPAVARVFLTAKGVEKLINQAVLEMKEYLSKNDKAKAIVENTTLGKD